MAVRRFRSFCAVLSLFVLSVPVPTAHGEEHYFLMVFGAQSIPNRPNYSHSFAAFVHAVGEGPGVENYALEAHTISWLPETLEIHTLRLLPERGHNLDLQTSLAFVASVHDRLSMWGPYEIYEELYNRALAQIDRLESGSVAYKAVDALHPASKTSNCIHALSDVTSRPHCVRLLSPGFGQIASYHMVLRFEPWIIDPDVTHDWVAARLGVDTDALIRRRIAEKPKHFSLR